jgi:16S rRNA (cytosine1402-N4)-methyltransferase
MADDPPKKKRRPFWRKRVRRSTAAGEHRPVLLAEVLAALDPRPGQTVVDCTLGFAGHSVELLKAVGPDGLLVATDLDPANLDPARAKLDAVGGLYALHHTNFAGLTYVLAAEGVAHVHGLLADLGMSSMQVDDRGRGFSFMRDGALDMRMDPTRGRTAADLLAALPEEELAAVFRDLGDESRASQTIAVRASVVSIGAVRRRSTIRRAIFAPSVSSPSSKNASASSASLRRLLRAEAGWPRVGSIRMSSGPGRR